MRSMRKDILGDSLLDFVIIMLLLFFEKGFQFYAPLKAHKTLKNKNKQFLFLTTFWVLLPDNSKVLRTSKTKRFAFEQFLVPLRGTRNNSAVGFANYQTIFQYTLYECVSKTTLKMKLSVSFLNNFLSSPTKNTLHSWRFTPLAN